MTSSKHPGIILRTQDLRESDLIIKLLCRELGKISAVALNAKNSKDKFFGGLEVFDSGVFELQEKKPMYRLVSIENKVCFLNLRNNLNALALATLCIEITDALLPEENHNDKIVFESLYYCLNALNKSKQNTKITAIAIYYILLLLKAEGLDILESQISFNPESKKWFYEMLSNAAPISTESSELEKQGLKLLISYVERYTGRTLNSRLIEIGSSGTELNSDLLIRRKMR